LTFAEAHSLRMKIKAGKATPEERARYDAVCAEVKKMIPPAVRRAIVTNCPSENEIKLAKRVYANASAPMRRRLLHMTLRKTAALAGRGTSREHAPRSTSRTTSTRSTRRASSASSSRTRPRKPAEDGEPHPDVEILAGWCRQVDRAARMCHAAAARTEPLFIAPIEASAS
jgi:hypothetical protein